MKRKETILFIVLLALLNLPLLLQGGPAQRWMYDPARVADGQILRLLTHPFVHVSGYHLLLDGAAFLLLYGQLAETSLVRRLGALLVIYLAVTVAVTLALPGLPVDTYCGLSGIGHGLMALCGLEMTFRNEKSLRQTGWACFAAVLIKSVLEVWTGNVFFGSMHAGSIGFPVVWAHLGGMIGAALVFTLTQLESFVCANKKIVTS